jgi:NAD+ synthase (glutamine-hydrolysing)
VPRLRIAACQLNPVVGDLDGNVARVLSMLRQAEDAGADLAVFPELCLVGYPPEDLLLKPGFVADAQEALARVARATASCAAVVGFVHADQDLHNAAAMCAGGAVVGIYHKRVLPNYTVFDEQRYFVPGGDGYSLYRVGGAKVGVSICEDAWSPTGPVAEQAAGGAELVVNVNASPYSAGRLADRARMLSTRAADASAALVYVNQIGGQDELVFDGASLVFDEFGELVASAPQFREELMVVDLEVRPAFRKRLLDPRGRPEAPPLPVVANSERPRARADVRSAPQAPVLGPVEEVYEALVLGTRDYVRKNGFSDAVVALSGGIDSSLVATIATDALGPDHVHGISMPSRYSSEGSLSDASSLAAALGIELLSLPIEPAHVAFGEMLGPLLHEQAGGVTDENVQSRIRGMVVMALTNALGWMVLTTGNKSELATGYWTLYGDSAGGYAVIKDVPKMLGYELARFRNQKAGRDLIPQAVLEKPPSAELRPDQRDDESLPPYAELDPVLHAYVDEDHTAAELVATGVDPELVARVASLVDRAEYKRRQTPIGPRVTTKAFGKDRRMPITNRYRALGPESPRPAPS